MIRLAVEDDSSLRLIQVILDQNCSVERYAAFKNFARHDVPDFPGWLEGLRAKLGPIYPAEVRMVEDQEELRQALPDVEAVVVEGLRVDAEEIRLAPKLRLIQKFGSNTVNLDENACRAAGVAVWAKQRRTNFAVAEHSFALLLALAKKLHQIDGLVTRERVEAAGGEIAEYDRRHTAGANWARVSGLMRLRGATFGVIGMGEIGREVARLAGAFGMNVLCTDRRPLSAAEQAEYGVSFVTLPELLAASDAVTVHVPYSKATHGLLAREHLAMLRSGCILINTARAELIDRDALLEALRNGRLGGVAIDALYEEPMREGDPLFGFDNVLLTPHLAGGSRLNGFADIEDMLVELKSVLTK